MIGNTYISGWTDCKCLCQELSKHGDGKTDCCKLPLKWKGSEIRSWQQLCTKKWGSMLKYEIAGQNKEDTASIRKLLNESGKQTGWIATLDHIPWSIRGHSKPWNTVETVSWFIQMEQGRSARNSQWTSIRGADFGLHSVSSVPYSLRGCFSVPQCLCCQNDNLQWRTGVSMDILRPLLYSNHFQPILPPLPWVPNRPT